jgi:hypothetical protein
MDKKSKIFFVIVLLALTVSVVLTYVRTMVSNDYRIIGVEENSGK